MEAYEKLVPSPTPETQPYWDGLNQGRLRLQRCADCGKVRHYPRPMCDACWSMNIDWVDASGRGTVHSWTITHYAFHPGFKGDLPYVLLTVDLPEGVRMNAQGRGIAIAGGTAGRRDVRPCQGRAGAAGVRARLAGSAFLMGRLLSAYQPHSAGLGHLM